MHDLTLQLPDEFDAPSVEAELAAAWERDRVYARDATRPRGQTFVVDTPPPTVSGSLHVGHVFSFTQTDVIVRYQRMRGRNIYYPMGWDDNGLPTERRVQRFFHVRVDPSAPPAEIAEPTPDERARPPRRVSRPTFIELCHRVTRADESAFQALFKRLALSVDWRETYATIDDRSRRLAQLSFLDLHANGHVYSTDAPTLWDIDFLTPCRCGHDDQENYLMDFRHPYLMHDPPDGTLSPVDTAMAMDSRMLTGHRGGSRPATSPC